MAAGKYNEGLRMGTIHGMSRLVRLSLYIIVLCTIGFSVDAQTTIGTSCPTVGWITLQPNQAVYCNTSNVWSLGEEITSTGNVGIGTTSPQSTLSVSGGVAIGTTYASTNAAASNNLIVQGGIAIGATGPGSYTTLLVAGNGNYNGAANVSVSTDNTNTFDSGIASSVIIGRYNAIYSPYNYNDDLIVGGGNVMNQTSSSVEIGSANNMTSAYTSMAVGANNTNSASNTITIGQYVTASAANSVTIGQGLSGNALLNSTAGSLMVGFNSNLATLFVGPASGANTTGNVGIGTTSPIDALDIGNRSDAITLPIGSVSQRPGSPVNGMIRYNSTTPTLEAYVNGAWSSLGGGGGSTITLGTSAAVTNPQRTGDATTGLFSPSASTVAVSTAGSERVRIDSSGFVGIGTTSPAVRLHVVAPNSTYGTTVAIDTGGTGQQAFTSYYEQGSQYWQLGKNVDQSLLIYDAKAHRTDFQIYSSGNMSLMGAGGNVGIGTAAPQSTLQVIGEAQVGSSGATCTSSNAGAIRYASSTMYYCNGSTWLPFSSSCYGSNSGSDTSLASNLLAYWKFDENTGITLYDATGNGNLGTFQGAAGSQWVTGKIGYGLQFSGNNYVSTNTGVANFGTGDFTVAGWYKTTASNGYMISKRSVCNYDAFFNILMSNGKLQVEIDDGTTSNLTTFADSSTSTDGNWHQFAFTRSGTSLNLFRDGSSVASAIAASTQNLYGSPVLSFATNPCSGNYVGSLDEIGVWSAALSSTQIAALYNSGTGNSYGALICYPVVNASGFVS